MNKEQEIIANELTAEFTGHKEQVVDVERDKQSLSAIIHLKGGKKVKVTGKIAVDILMKDG